jgi:3',5'-cyclic AMP phosphodiesterase CpdA
MLFTWKQKHGKNLKRPLDMKIRHVFIAWFLIVNLLVATSLVSATPLSLDQNIAAIMAMQDGFNEGFDFVVIGDNRDGPEVYRLLLNRAKSFNPLFVLNTGDIVNEGIASEYNAYEKHIAAYDLPIVHVPGNHDVRKGPDRFSTHVGQPNWYFDIGGFRIIGLDNSSGTFSTEAVEFARRVLTKDKICLVAFHKPPPVGRWMVHAMMKDEKGGRWLEIEDLIKEARVPMVFLGHIHLYDEMDMGGTKYVISAGGGARLYDTYNFGKPEHGFVLVQARPKGITHRWVPLK